MADILPVKHETDITERFIIKIFIELEKMPLFTCKYRLIGKTMCQYC